jgi:hypothetical protein
MACLLLPKGMAARSDCSDFGVPNIIRVLYSKGQHSLDTDPYKRAQLKQGILGWQYWIDQIEGTAPDNHFEGGMEVWTENHQMDFHASDRARPSIPSWCISTLGDHGWCDRGYSTVDH